MTTERKLNKRLLRKVRDRIAKIPESYSQDHFWLNDKDAPCGTVACLAGETIIVSRPSIKQGLRSLRRLSNIAFCEIADHPIVKRAGKLLGLSKGELMVFDGEAFGWPQPYRSRFKQAETNKQRAKVAVAYLDECLKRGKMVW
jgi:hypothetical protein